MATITTDPTHNVAPRYEEPTHRYVKIVATLGPAVATRATLSALIDAGVDVARINCSHGTIDERARLIELLRDLADERNLLIPVLMDLRGLKIRTGPLEGSDAVPLA